MGAKPPEHGVSQATHAEGPKAPAKAPAALIAYGQPYVLADRAREEEPEREVGGISADGWVAIFTGVLTMATILLWRATEKTINHARVSSEHELRAYVSAEPTFVVAFDATHFAGAKVKLKNHGASPARQLNHRIEIGLLPYPFQPGDTLPELSDGASAPTVLFPGAELEGNKTAKRLFTVDEIAAIKAATKAVCIYGEVAYLDIFNQPRWTKFCSYVAADGPTLEKLASAYVPKDLEVKFAIAPMGNDAK